MNQPLFSTLNNKIMALLVAKARDRVVYVAPGIWPAVAEVIVARRQARALREVVISLDFDERVLRLGYGDLKAVESLRTAEIDVSHSPGLRTAFFIIDDEGWVFTPTALLLEEEPRSEETPNAIRLTPDQVREVLLRVSPAVRENVSANDPTTVLPPLEIGLHNVTAMQMASVKSAIALAPPLAFDLARQVRVFQPYLQYADIELNGAAIERKKITIPPSIQNLNLGKELEEQIEERMRTTFDLIAKDDELSSKLLKNELVALRKALTRSLPKFGRVILKNARPRFDERIKELQGKVVAHGKNVKEKLAARLAASRKAIVDYYLPRVEQSPPDELYGSLLVGNPGQKEIRQWLERELNPVFPSADELISEMELFVEYKDVTFETLSQPDFFAQLKLAYPDIEWDKPFAEFKAAEEKRAG